MIKQHVSLTAEDKLKLINLLEKGSLKTRVFKRVMSLLELDKGKTYKEVVQIVHLSRTSQTKLVAKYKSEGLNCLYDQPRSGRPITITSEQKDKITLLSLEKAPEGYSQWSIRLIDVFTAQSWQIITEPDYINSFILIFCTFPKRGFGIIIIGDSFIVSLSTWSGM